MPHIEKIKTDDQGSLGAIFGWVAEYWGRHRLRMAALLGMTMVTTAMAISYPIFFKLVVDGLVDKVSVGQLNRNILYLMLLGGGAAVTNWLLMSTRGWTNMHIEADLRNSLFGKLTKLGPGFYSGHRTGDLVTRLTDDLAEKLSWFTCSGVFRAAQGLVVFVFILLVMFRINWLLALCSLVPVPAVAFLFVFNEKRFERRYHRLQGAISAVNDFLESCFSGIRVLKVYNRLDHQRQGFSKTMDGRVRAEVRSIQSEGLFNSSNSLIDQMGVMVVLLVGGYLAIKGRLSLGSFVAFNTYSLMMIEPLWNMGYFFVTAKRASVSYNRTLEISRAAVDVKDPDRPMKARFERSITMDNVSFGYNGSEVIRNVSFTVDRGKKVALMGEVGSGKSTLVHLLLRLYDPFRGSIMLDGEDIRNFRLDDLRSLIGYAPQEALLFSETILNNVIFHRPDVDEPRALEAGRIAHLDSEVEGFPKRYHTEIGQRGVSLSGGQKQRASLARAIVDRLESGHPRILILDDITSALDASTEALVWGEIQERLPEVTCFIISHRTSTIERADRIIVLKEGEIVEQGTHRELMEKGGYYVALREREKLKEDGNGIK